VLERLAPGGQAGTSARIENYPGFPHGVGGADLTRGAHEQVLRFGAELLTGTESAHTRRRMASRSSNSAAAPACARAPR
jgi:thioredoxin reductase (NADPH)